MFLNKFPSNVSLYKSLSKDFIMITKIVNKPNGIMIKRNICYLDHKTNKRVRRTEIQHFDCAEFTMFENSTISLNENEEDVSDTLDPYCLELQKYVGLLDTNNENTSTVNVCLNVDNHRQDDETIWTE